MPIPASAGFQGFCQGATPFSSMLMIRSVTSCRKSRGFVTWGSAGRGSMLVVAIPLFLLTGIQSESGLRLFSFEPGAGKRLTTDTFELGLDFVVQKLWIVHLASLG